MDLSPPNGAHWLRACARGNIEELEAMAGGEPWPDVTSETPKTSSLILAAANGHVEICKRLLAHQPHLDFEDGHDGTPLLAAMKNGRKTVVDLLLRHGADPNHVDQDWRTPLMIMALDKNSDMAARILKKGAAKSINHTDPEGMTALMLLAYGQPYGENGNMVEMFLAYGADPNLPSKDRERALGLAIDRGQVSMIVQLLKGGAKTTYKTSTGSTYLHAAVDSLNVAVVALLLDAGMDPLKEDKSGITPQSMADAKGWGEGFRQLRSTCERNRLHDKTAVIERVKRSARL